MLEFMTREIFDALIIAVIVIGVALAAVRLYADFTRPLPEERRREQEHWMEEDSQSYMAEDSTTEYIENVENENNSAP